jgi:hypothetical protein
MTQVPAVQERNSCKPGAQIVVAEVPSMGPWSLVSMSPEPQEGAKGDHGHQVITGS